MKRRILQLACAFLLAGFGNVSAQITIVSADYGSVGTTVMMANDTNASISVGSSGMNQTWNFSTLTFDLLETLDFVDPVTTNSGTTFPGSNLAVESITDTIFHKIDTTALYIDGLAGDIGGVGVSLAVNLSPDLKVLDFPTTFGDSFMSIADVDTTVEDIYVNLGDSIRVHRVVTVNSQIDAWGTLTTPAGTYNCIRQRIQQTDDDTAWVKLPFIGWQQLFAQSTTTHRYLWLANGEDFPVLEIVADAPNGNALTTSYKIGVDVVAFISASQGASCNGDCDGTAAAMGVSGSGTYTYLWDAGAGNATTAAVTGLCAGTYSVTVSDGVGSDVTTVTINEPAVLDLSASVVDETNFGNDGEIALTVTGGAGGNSYSWTGPNGFTFTGKDLTGIAGGDYTVVVTDQNGCTATDTYTVIGTTVPTGINESAQNTSISVYPNPSNGTVFMKSETTGTIYIIDLLGNTVASQSKNATRATLDLSDLSGGIYFLRFESTAGDTTVRKLQLTK